MTSNLKLEGTDTLLLLILGAASILLSGCRNREVPTNWAEHPIVIDGAMEDWAGYGYTYLKNEKALLGFCNDDENLYILLRFGEPSWMKTFMMGHLTVWVDAQCGRNRDLGFRYSGGITPRDMVGGRGGIPGREGAPPSGGREPTMTEKPAQLEVITGGEEEVRRIALDGSEGPKVKVGIRESILTLELSIPLAGRPEDCLGIDVGPGEELSIGFELKMDQDAMTQQMPQGGMPGGGGMPGRGGGGQMPGGGKGGGMQPGGTSLPSERKIWIRTVLAEPEISPP